MNPYKILSDAIRAVPSVRYALAVAGIGAAVAIILGFIKDPRIAVFGILITIGLMFIVVIFSHAAKDLPGVRWLAATLAWTITLLFIASLVSVFTAFAFGYPKPLASYFGKNEPLPDNPQPIPGSQLATTTESTPKNLIREQSASQVLDALNAVESWYRDRKFKDIYKDRWILASGWRGIVQGLPERTSLGACRFFMLEDNTEAKVLVESDELACLLRNDDAILVHGKLSEWTIDMLTISEATLSAPQKSASTPDTTMPDNPAESPERAINEWFALIDKEEYLGAWAMSSKISQANYDQKAFIDVYYAQRKPLGSPVERVLYGLHAPTALPDGRKGNFRLYTYRTQFSSGPEFFEAVLLTTEDNKWKVLNHNILPAPK